MFLLFLLSSCAEYYYRVQNRTVFTDEKKNLEYVLDEGVDIVVRPMSAFRNKKKRIFQKLYVLNADFDGKSDRISASYELSKKDTVFLTNAIYITPAQFKAKKREEKVLKYKGLLFFDPKINQNNQEDELNLRISRVKK